MQLVIHSDSGRPPCQLGPPSDSVTGPHDDSEWREGEIESGSLSGPTRMPAAGRTPVRYRPPSREGSRMTAATAPTAQAD